MYLFLIIYLAGCAVSLVGGIISDKLANDLTIWNLITIIGFSVFSWALIIVILCAAIEGFVRDSHKIQKFLDKKL